MSECRNIDSLRSSPDLTSPMTPRQMEAQIHSLLAKIALLEERIAKAERRIVSKPAIKDMIGCQERRFAARFVTRPNYQAFALDALDNLEAK